MLLEGNGSAVDQYLGVVVRLVGMRGEEGDLGLTGGNRKVVIGGPL